jgi:hypothetical protein
MAISFVAAGSTVTGANPTVPVPTGYAAGDVFILFITAGTVTTPSGWTLRGITTSGTPLAVYSKIAGASESSVAMTSGNANSIAGMIAYRGSSGVDVAGTFATTASATSLATNTQTTTQANDYVISIYADSVGARTWTAPASTTVRLNASSVSTFRGILIVDELQASAGVTTARTATVSTASALTALAISINESTSTNKGSFFFLM